MVKVGSSCNRIKAGDNVYGMTDYRVLGSFAEYAIAPEANAALKPAQLSFIEAASLPCVGVTGYQALKHKADIKVGQRVLVLGGAGGTGSFAVQLAAAVGASRIVATCSGRNADFVKELGATECIDYNEKKWHEELAAQDFDVVYDCVGEPDSYSLSHRILKPSGRFVSIASKNSPNISIGSLISSGAQLVGRKLLSFFPSYPNYSKFRADTSRHEDLDAITELVRLGKIKPLVSKTYPLEKCVESFEEVVAGRTRGKIVFAISAEANQR